MNQQMQLPSSVGKPLTPPAGWAPPERQAKVMLRRSSETPGMFEYWSLLRWSEIYAMGLDPETAKTHAERLMEDGYAVEVIPFQRIEIAKKKTEPGQYRR